MPNLNANKIFISYSRTDRDFADRISRLLRNRGFTIIDPMNDIRSGEKWGDEAVRLLKSADGLIFVVPAREGEGKNALAELGAARALGKQIVAVMPDASRAWNAGFARQLADSAVVDASRFKDDTLVDALALAS